MRANQKQLDNLSRKRRDLSSRAGDNLDQQLTRFLVTTAVLNAVVAGCFW
jgi:hypothetical protein